MMMLLGLLLAAAVVVAFIASSAAAKANVGLATQKTQIAALEKNLATQTAAQADVRKELQEAKQALREEKDAHKASKKKAFDKKSAPMPIQTQAVTPVHTAAPAASHDREQEMADQVRELDKAWRAQSEQLSKAEATLKEAQAQAQALAAKLERAEAAKAEITQLRQALDSEKQRVGAEAKSILDMRRKVEWYRRIHLVQKNEIQVEKDKTAHVRQRLIEAYSELLRNGSNEEQKAELDRLKREEAAYQTVSAKEGANLH